MYCILYLGSTMIRITVDLWMYNSWCVYSRPVTMWTFVHPARWYYKIYVKELIRRARSKTATISKSNYIRAAENVMGRTIWKQRISNIDLMKRFTEKSADINKKFFKVNPYSNNYVLMARAHLCDSASVVRVCLRNCVRVHVSMYACYSWVCLPMVG